MTTYTKPTISNYNDNPPTNDGSQNDTDNLVDWDRHIDEIGDPLNNYIDSVNNAADAGFDKVDASRPLSVKDKGAIGDGVTDDTVAIQAAIDEGETIYIPEGLYLISDELTLPTTTGGTSGSGYVIYGDGMEKSIIFCQGMTGKDGIIKETASEFLRITMRDFQVTGDCDNAIQLDGTGGGLVYQSLFQNLFLKGHGANAFKCNLQFSTLFMNVHVSSDEGHGFDIQGGNSTTFISCYAHNITKTGMAGYRIHGRAVMIGCNGLDTGETWGYFGADTGEGDPASVFFYITMIGCNVESFTVRGINCRLNGRINLINNTWVLPATGSPVEYIRIKSCSKLVDISNDAFLTLGSSISSPAEIYAETGINIQYRGSELTDYYQLNISSLVNLVQGGYNPTEQTWTVDSATFALGTNDRVVTANTGATTFTHATGAIAGQGLKIRIGDANTTIEHENGGAGQFSLIKGADYIASIHDVLMFTYDGGSWLEHIQTT